MKRNSAAMNKNSNAKKEKILPQGLDETALRV